MTLPTTRRCHQGRSRTSDTESTITTIRVAKSDATRAADLVVRAGNRWGRRRAGEEQAQSQSAVRRLGCSVLCATQRRSTVYTRAMMGGPMMEECDVDMRQS